MRVTEKTKAARASLARRFHGGQSSGKTCMALLDVLTFRCNQNPASALAENPDFWSIQAHRLTKGGYGRGHWLRRKGSAMKVAIESEPRERWLAPCRVVLYADDRTGLLPDEVLAVLEVMSEVRLARVELAIDFSPVTNVSRNFVRRHAVFGKSDRDRSSVNPAGEWWGSRKGGKRVKSYFKDEISGQRVEFGLRTRFLHPYRIKTVFDLWRLAEVLPHRHILFAWLDPERLHSRLRRDGLSARAIQQVTREVNRRENDLCGALQYLRRQAQLKNVRRLLIPLPENRLVEDALRDWAARWPRRPRRL